MADDNVVKFSGFTRLAIDPDNVLTEAVGKLERVVVIGVTKEGDEYYFSTSDPKVGTILWDLESAKRILFDNAESF